MPGSSTGPANPEPADDSTPAPEAASWHLDGIVVHLGRRAAASGCDASAMDSLRLVLIPGPRGIGALVAHANKKMSGPSWRGLAGLDGRPPAVTVELPREAAVEFAPLAALAEDTVLDTARSDLLCEHLSTLIAHFPQLDACRRGALAAASLCVIAAVVAPAEPARDGAVNPMSMQMIERARLVTRRNMGSSEFDPEELCRLLAVSRSKLYRYFEPIGGVGRFIQHERLLEARRRLVDTAEMPSIQAVVAAVGFLDHSTFSRAFRRTFGFSPREARERQRAATVAPDLADP
jgi:AraC-like DNA-binding protein